MSRIEKLVDNTQGLNETLHQSVFDAPYDVDALEKAGFRSALIEAVSRLGKIWPLEAHTLRPVQVHR